MTGQRDDQPEPTPEEIAAGERIVRMAVALRRNVRQQMVGRRFRRLLAREERARSLQRP